MTTFGDSLGRALGVAAPKARLRPQKLAVESAAALYAAYDGLFLGGVGATKNVFESSSGYSIIAFDHNFFHLAKFSHPVRGKKLHAPFELPIVKSLTSDFGEYNYDPYRALFLPTALEVFVDPDELIELGNPGEASHCFATTYGGGKSPVTLSMAKLHKKGKMIPVTSYAVDEDRLRKIRAEGKTIWKKRP